MCNRYEDSGWRGVQTGVGNEELRSTLGSSGEYDTLLLAFALPLCQKVAAADELSAPRRNQIAR